MTNKLIIFDCDGTLIESEHSNNTAVSLSLAELGYANYDVNYCIKKFRGKSIIDIVKIINNENEQEINQEKFIKLIKEKSLYANYHMEPVRNAIMVLEQLSLPKCVASNGDRACILKYLDQLDMLKYFGMENIFTKEQVMHPKPSPDMFLLASKTFQTAPQNTIVIEDSETGIHAAKAANMIAIGFTGTAYKKDQYKNILSQAGADYIIEDLKELLDLLPKIFIGDLSL
jgi:HAD superfamily hydrolase (TIGR01509 family)